MTAVELVQTGMEKAVGMTEELGVTMPVAETELLVPLTAFSFTCPKKQPSPDDRFWLGCLALQMAHEASIHRTDSRLKRPRDLPESVHHNLHLAGSFRVAALTGLHEFLVEFMEAVNVMIQEEYVQSASETSDDRMATYTKNTCRKSSALLGISASLPSWTGESVSTREMMRRIGGEIGILHQMVGDFLDYCPIDNTGKPKLQNFYNRIWTFVLGTQGMEWFDQLPQEAISIFFRRNNKPSMAEKALSHIKEKGAILLSRIQDVGAQPPIINIIHEWMDCCTRALQENSQARIMIPKAFRLPSELSHTITGAQIALQDQHLGDVSNWQKFFSANSRSFSFSARLFPPEERSLIIGIYAFCRFTDNLVDKDCGKVAQAYQRLDTWSQITQSAYHGYTTGISVADVVMRKMAEMKIPYSLVSELIEGMRMDVEPYTYRSMEDLRRYTYRVASVVGAWITYAFGIRDPWVLQRAHDLGHAMQLTNIVRDVGEDLSMGRIYLPADLMKSHNITSEVLEALKHQSPKMRSMPANYIALLEEIITEADGSYQSAYEGMPSLPPRLRRPIAVAAQVYRGIHKEVSLNGYNNLTRRAYTSLWKKTVLAREGLQRLKQISKTPNQ